MEKKNIFDVTALVVTSEDLQLVKGLYKRRISSIFTKITGKNLIFRDIMAVEIPALIESIANYRKTHLNCNYMAYTNRYGKLNKDQVSALSQLYYALADGYPLDAFDERPSDFRAFMLFMRRIEAAHHTAGMTDKIEGAINIHTSKSARNKAKAKHDKKYGNDKKEVEKWWLEWQNDPGMYKNKTAFDDAMRDKATGVTSLATITKWRKELQKKHSVCKQTIGVC